MPGAVRFTTGTDYYTNTATTPTATFTVTCWACLRVDRNTYTSLWAISGSGATSNNDLTVETDVDGTTMKLWATAGFSVAGQAMTVDTWYRFGVAKSGTTATLYYGPATGALTTTTRATLATSVVTEVSIGSFRIAGAGAEFLNGSLAAFKLWNGVALTAAEIAAELTQYNPVQRANLQRYYSFAGGPQTGDESGNGFTLTPGAAAATLDPNGPPIPIAIEPQIQPYTARRRAAIW